MRVAATVLLTVGVLGCVEGSVEPIPPAVVARTRAEAPAIIRLSQMQPGDRIDVRIASRGCFHDVANTMTFTRRDIGASLQNRNERLSALIQHDYIVVDSVTDLELSRLDTTLDIYRGPRSGVCTTVDTFDITLYRGDTVVRREHLVEGSCRLMLLDHEGRLGNALSFGSLFRRKRTRSS